MRMSRHFLEDERQVDEGRRSSKYLGANDVCQSTEQEPQKTSPSSCRTTVGCKTQGRSFV